MILCTFVVTAIVSNRGFDDVVRVNLVVDIIRSCYNQFSCFTVPIPISGGSYGPGLGEIRLAGLQCTGTERNLTSCPITRNFFSLFCSHFDDAGVLCPGKHTTDMCGYSCLLYTSPSPRDATLSRMPSSA